MGDAPPTNVGLADAAGVTLAGKIMVGTIVTLFFVVVIILCVHIYARVFLPRRSAGVRRRFSFDSADGAADGPRRAAAAVGVDPAVLKSLPVVVFKAAEREKGLECAVCLAEVAEGEKARMLPGCGHGFHVGCIDMWLQSHSTCPLCRSPVGPQPPDRAATSDNNGTFTAHGIARVGPAEAVDFPTNVLFWGNEVQVSSRAVGSDDSMMTSVRPAESLAIDIPTPRITNLCDSCSSSSLRPNDPDEARSPLSSRLRSLTRLWSMNKRANVAATSSSTADAEPGDARV